MPRATGSGLLTFGLVSIPFRTHLLRSPRERLFHLLHATCGTRLKGGGSQTFCPACNVICDSTDIRRGVEVSANVQVTFTDAELKGLKEPRAEHLEVLEFVPAETFDPIYIRRSDVLAPIELRARSYALLRDAMVRSKRIAIGRHTTKGRARPVALAPYGERHILVHELFYEEEIRDVSEVDVCEGGAEFDAVERDLADALIANLARPAFDPSRYRDARADRLREAVLAKVERSDTEPKPVAPRANVIDMLEALKRSVESLRAPSSAASNVVRLRPKARS